MLPDQLYYYKVRGVELILATNERDKLTLTVQFINRKIKTLTFPLRPRSLIQALEKLEKDPEPGISYPYKTYGLWGNVHLISDETDPLPYWVVFNAEDGTASYQFAEETYMEFLHVIRDFYNK